MSQDDLEIDLDAIQRRMDGAINALRFEGVVHETPILSTVLPVRTLRHPLLHHSRETIYGSLIKLAQILRWLS